MDLNPLHCSKNTLIGALSVACTNSISPSVLQMTRQG